MTPNRVIVYSLLGFIAPVVISLGLSSVLYSHQVSARSLARESASPESIANQDSRTEFEERTSSSISVPSRVTFDPAAERDFLVSFIVSLERLPNEGQRQHLVGKYTNRAPYEGWAVGVRKLTTSLRPEVYWRGQDGSGGWMSFDEAKLKPQTPYALTLVARPGQFAALFYQELQANSDGGFDSVGKPTYAGAQELLGVRTPKTEAPLNVGIRLPHTDRFLGEISRLLISYPTNLPRKFDQMDPLISGGPAAVEASLDKAEINFSLGEEGRQVKTPSFFSQNLLSLWG